ncbi:MAG: nucleotidyltransferase domain-containing protein [Eubacteriaceae bacterium]|nr:nucleotidyltransferase domain-containing protein [Eubacteriaceae bacterium]
MDHYSIDEIKAAIYPIAQKYNVARIALFGSYARGDAGIGSDIDLHLMKTVDQWGYFKLLSFRHDLEAIFGVSVDVLTTGAMDSDVLENVQRDEIIIYEC